MFEGCGVWDIVGVFGVVIGLPALSWALVKWARYLDVRTENALMERTIYAFNTILTGLVREMDQTVVDPLKKARAPGGGGRSLLVDREKRSFSKSIVERLKLYLTPEGVARVAKAFGMDPRDRERIEGFLLSQVESAVSLLKTEKATREASQLWEIAEGEAEGPFEGGFAPR